MENTPIKKLPSLLLLGLLFTIIELLFIFPTWDLFLAPLLALLLCYLYFAERRKMLVTVILMLGNDALGTLLLGSVSTVYLIFLFLLYELLNLKKIRVRTLVLFVFGAFLSFLPALTGVVTIKAALLTVSYLAMLFVLYQKEPSNDGFLEKLKTSIMGIVLLQALHLLITGGVLVSDTTARAGLIGLGIGDANYSALILCVGVAAILTTEKLRWYWKLLSCGVLLAAMIATLSISGLLTLLVVIVLSLSLTQKSNKVFLRVCLILLALVFIFQVYVALPENLHIDGVDDYIARVEEKLDFLEEGDYDAATTDRSALAKYKLNYFFQNLSILHQFFGLNALTIGDNFMSHNTYIDFLLQLGIVGAIISLLYAIVRLFHSITDIKNGAAASKYVLTVKALFLFFAFTVSIYQGPIFALFFLTCFLL